MSPKQPQPKFSIQDILKDQALFQIMVSAIGEDLMLIRRDGRIVYANAAAVRSFGYSRKSLLNRRITRFFKNKISLRTWQKKYFNKVKNAKRPYTFEVKRKVKGGKVRDIEVTAAHIKHQGQEFMLVIGRDVTIKKYAENQLKESEKMRILNQFVLGAANEIKSPLEAVVLKTRRLSRQYKDRHFEYIGFKEFQDILRSIDGITKQLSYCCDTTNRLLRLSKKEAGIRHKHCEVNRLIRETFQVMTQQLELANIALKLRLQPRLPAAAIDPIDFHQALMNIATNSFQAMPGGGRMTVRTFMTRGSKRVCIQIKDEGIGISKENLARVFEPFFTTKHRGLEKSSGLGLSIVHSIIHAAGGEISFKSNLRRGTMVQILLPLVPGARA